MKRRVAGRSEPHWLRAHGDATVAALIGAVVIGSVLAVGAVHVPVLVVAAALAGTGAGIALWRGERWPLPAIICAALAGWSALQSLPLPVAVVAFVAPRNLAVWEGAFTLLRDPLPGWLPLSVDPGASRVEALKWTTYALVFVAAAHLARKRGAGWGTSIVFVSSVVAGFATVAHGLLGATKVFGIYQPVYTPAPWHVGPLINPNNLSGYLTLGTLVGLGALLSSRRSVPAWLVGLGVASNVAVNATAASRAGVIALPVGVFILGIAMLLQRSARTARAAGQRSAWWLVALAFAGGAALALLGITVDAWRELWSQNIEKLTAIRFVIPLLKDHVWVGTGRGAFETVFPAYRNAPGHVVFTHAESFPVDWAAGWGIPVAACALIGFAWCLRRRAIGAHRGVVAAAGWAGLLALLLQNLADLGLEVPALPIAVAVVWGTLLGRLERRAHSDAGAEGEGPSGAWWRGAALAAGTLAVTLSVLYLGRASPDADRREVQRRLGSMTSSIDERTAVRAELRAAIRRHPADPYFPLIGAVLAWKHRDESPMPWLSWSLERDLTNGRAHLLAAEVVGARGSRSQALLELRLAVQDDYYLADAAAPLAVRWAQRCEQLTALAPGGFAGAHVLSALSVATRPALAHCRGPLVTEALRRAPDAPWPRKLAASSLLARLGDPKAEPSCAGDRRASCEAELEQHARVLQAAEPKLSAPVQLRAQLLRLRGNAAEGAELLKRSCGAYDDRDGCLHARVSITAEVPPPNDLQSAIKDYVAAACLSAAACAAAATSMGDLLMARGDAGGAAIYFERATREAPTEARWSSLAVAASRSGAHVQAAAALEHVAQLRGGGDAEIQRRIQEERTKALGLR